MLPDTGYGRNGFWVKFNSAGQRQWGTYLGSRLFFSYVTGTVLPATGETVLYVGSYNQVPSPAPVNATPGAYQPHYSDSGDVVLAQYDTAGVKRWSTYYGGIGMEPIVYGFMFWNGSLGISLTPTGNLLLVGGTSSTSGIQKGCYPYPARHPQSFISEWQPNGQLLWSSYYEGYLGAVCAGAGNNIYVGGYTNFDSLATPGALQTSMVSGKPTGLLARFTSVFVHCPQMQFPVTVQNNSLLQVAGGYAGYQWYANGSPIATATQYTFTAGDTGTYYVVLTDSCGCVYTSDTVRITTGIAHSANGRMAVSIYPNPSGDGHYVLSGQLPLSGAHTLSYTVTDMLGKTGISSGFSVQHHTFTHPLDLSAFADGIYFLKLQSKTGYSVLKVVKGK
jgi:hypothetical protein